MQVEDELFRFDETGETFQQPFDRIGGLSSDGVTEVELIDPECQQFGTDRTHLRRIGGTVIRALDDAADVPPYRSIGRSTGTGVRQLRHRVPL